MEKILGLEYRRKRLKKVGPMPPGSHPGSPLSKNQHVLRTQRESAKDAGPRARGKLTELH